MSLEGNRLLLLLDKELRDSNREAINKEIDHLTIEGLKPVLRMVAKSRAAYLKALFSLSELSTAELPSDEQIAELKKQRNCYEELLAASQAMETAIERNYMDVSSK
jgi:hypothetical protein